MNLIVAFFQQIFYNSSWELIGAVISLTVTILSYYQTLQQRAKKRRLAEKAETTSFKEKMEKLSSNLSYASSEVDNIVTEMETVAKHREQALKSLEEKLAELSVREQEMKTKVESLEKIPLPAVEYFLQATEKGEKRSAARDYILFGAGVVVSTIISIILKYVFNI